MRVRMTTTKLCIVAPTGNIQRQQRLLPEAQNSGSSGTSSAPCTRHAPAATRRPRLAACPSPEPQGHTHAVVTTAGLGMSDLLPKAMARPVPQLHTNLPHPTPIPATYTASTPCTRTTGRDTYLSSQGATSNQLIAASPTQGRALPPSKRLVEGLPAPAQWRSNSLWAKQAVRSQAVPGPSQGTTSCSKWVTTVSFAAVPAAATMACSGCGSVRLV